MKHYIIFLALMLPFMASLLTGGNTYAQSPSEDMPVDENMQNNSEAEDSMASETPPEETPPPTRSGPVFYRNGKVLPVYEPTAGTTENTEPEFPEPEEEILNPESNGEVPVEETLEPTTESGIIDTTVPSIPEVVPTIPTTTPTTPPQEAHSAASSFDILSMGKYIGFGILALCGGVYGLLILKKKRKGINNDPIPESGIRMQPATLEHSERLTHALETLGEEADEQGGISESGTPILPEDELPTQ